MASSALVFTSRVELLKLAVILALWAAVVAAFVSVIYRRQSDVDQAKARDLKLVYDLQLDREISARREYELTVESELRRELSTEIRAQAADEVAALRAELAALRANLEYPLRRRPESSAGDRDRARACARPGRISSSRIDTDEGPNLRTEENPIIDVSAEPHAPEHEWSPTALFGGAHRRPSEAEPTAEERIRGRPSSGQPNTVPPRSAPRPSSAPSPSSARPSSGPRPSSGRRNTVRRSSVWPSSVQPNNGGRGAAGGRRACGRTASARTRRRAACGASRRDEAASRPRRPIGSLRPPRGSGSRPEPRAATGPPSAAENGSSGEYVGRRRAAEPAMSTPPRNRAPRASLRAARCDRPGRPQPPHPPTLAPPPPQPDAARRACGRGRTAPSQCRRGRESDASPPADTPSPSCWPDWKSVRREAAVVAAAKSELVS